MSNQTAAEVTFYDVKLKKSITVPLSRCRKVRFAKPGRRPSHAVSTLLDGDRRVLKFISAEQYQALEVPADLDVTE